MCFSIVKSTWISPGSREARVGLGMEPTIHLYTRVADTSLTLHPWCSQQRTNFSRMETTVAPKKTDWNASISVIRGVNMKSFQPALRCFGLTVELNSKLNV